LKHGRTCMLAFLGIVACLGIRATGFGSGARPTTDVKSSRFLSEVFEHEGGKAESVDDQANASTSTEIYWGAPAVVEQRHR